MYKVNYTLSGGSLKSKEFETLHEATVFANQQPIGSVLEIKINHEPIKKPERN
jgi:hypothetical protein